MKLERFNDSIAILANLGIIVGLIFVALEIRTNTETNLISIYEASSTNWLELNGQQTNREIAELLERAFSDSSLDNIELRQFDGWIRQQLTHAAFIRRLHRSGLLTDEELRTEFNNGIRQYRNYTLFRQRINSLVQADNDFRGLILDDEGIEVWLASQ